MGERGVGDVGWCGWGGRALGWREGVVEDLVGHGQEGANFGSQVCGPIPLDMGEFGDFGRCCGVFSLCGQESNEYSESGDESRMSGVAFRWNPTKIRA